MDFMKKVANKATLSLFFNHGLGEYDNWLTMRKDSLPRKKVLDALKDPDQVKRLEEFITSMEQHLEVARGLLDESNRTN